MLSLILFPLLLLSSLVVSFPGQHSHSARALGEHGADRRRNSFQQRNLDTITRIYERNAYPTNLQFIINGSSSVPAGLFNENAAGRITPLGNFTGFKESTEYFFALSPVPLPPTYGAFSKIQIVEFQSQCANVASSVVYITMSVIHPGAPNDGQLISTLKQACIPYLPRPLRIARCFSKIAFWEFDDSGAVLKYDAWIPNIALFNRIGHDSNSGNVTSADTHAATIQILCTEIQAECTGSNTQYTNPQNCIDVLSAKPFGDWDEVWMDSVVCRELHILLARIDPLTHCPHVGPTGGSKCINEPYEDGYFLSDEALFGKPEGQNFVCENDRSFFPW